MKLLVFKKTLIAFSLLWLSLIFAACSSITSEPTSLTGTPGQTTASPTTGTGATNNTTVPPSTTLPNVTVSEIQATEITVSGSMYVSTGTTNYYTATVIPDNAVNLSVEWSVTSRGGQADIDQSGALHAISPGGVTVKATSTNGLFAEKNVAILSVSIPVQSVEILGEELINHGERSNYSIAVTPVNATYRQVEWEIESGEAKIDGNGRLAPKGSGSVVISVSVDGVITTKMINVAAYTGSVSDVKVLLNRVDLRNTVLKDYEREFEALFPMYNVTFETLLDYENNSRIRLMGGDYGDVLLIPSSVSAQNLPYYFAPIGSLESLSQSWRYVSQKAYNGLVYGLPTYGNVNGIIYNKKVFANAGIENVPTTPEAFLAAMQIIKSHYSTNSDFIAPFYTNKKDSWPLDQWQGNVSSVSGDPNYYYNILPEDRNAFSVGSPHYIVYKLLYDLVRQGLIENDPSTTNWERSKVEFVKGNIGSMVAGSWAVSQFVDVAIKVRDGTHQYDNGTPVEQSDLANPADVGYMPFPYTNTDGKIYSAHSPDFFIGIKRNTTHMQGSIDFMMWFLQESGYYQFTGGIPPRSDMPFPAVIQAFEDLGTILFEEVSATGPMLGKLELVESNSGIVLWNPDWKSSLFENAYYDLRTYNQITSELNDLWNLGIDLTE
ncbi:MAG: extracellular solute-binding protein [Candidatus Izemoplasmatales bacterium]|jgi:ABC-type glycerol-3-phosphate transport system substrate-binding protein